MNQQEQPAAVAAEPVGHAGARVAIRERPAATLSGWAGVAVLFACGAVTAGLVFLQAAGWTVLPELVTANQGESGIVELGGHPMVLRSDELQLTRGESIRDTAYVLSRHAAAVGIRTGPDELVSEFAEHAQVPVRHRVPAAIGQHCRDGGGERAQCPDHCAFHHGAFARHRVCAEHRVRVVVLARDDPFDLTQAEVSQVGVRLCHEGHSIRG